MSLADYITTHGKRVKKEHYIHLVQVARIDSRIEKSELDLLHKEGRKFGLTDPEIDAILTKRTSSHYTPPYSLHEKFEELYNIAVIVLADEKVTSAEQKMIRRYAIAAGFDDETIDLLIDHLFEGIRKFEDVDELFISFKKKLRARS
jgi:uncharacterized tellurite resistance protein B-like protein